MALRVAGVAYIKADGNQFTVKSGVEAPISQVTREAVMGLAGVGGYKETAQEPYVKFTSVFTADLNIQTITTSTNMTVTVEFANGYVYTLSGAYLRGEPTGNGEEGTLELEFSGLKGTWQ